MDEAGEVPSGVSKVAPRVEGIRERFGRLADLKRLGRSETQQYGGVGGAMERMFQQEAEQSGKDSIGQEARKFTNFIKGKKGEVSQVAMEMGILGDEAKVARISGGVREIGAEVRALTGAEATMLRRKEAISQNLKEAAEAYKRETPERQKEIGRAFEEVVTARQDMQNQLGELWGIQSHVDEINEAEYLAADYDTKKDIGKIGRVGGPVRRVAAWVGGIPGGVGERAAAAASPRTFSEERVRSLVSAVHADVLARASVSEKYDMWEKGIITGHEFGRITNEERNKLLDEAAHNPTRRGKSEENTGGLGVDPTKDKTASMKDRIAYLKTFELKKAGGARDLFLLRKQKYLDRVKDTASLGLVGAPLTEISIKMGNKAIDGAVLLVKDAKGGVEFVYEDIREVLVKPVMKEMMSTAAAREVAAASYQKALGGTDEKAKLEAAAVLRGAQTMYDRAALWVARTNDHVGKGLLDAPRYLTDSLLKGWMGGERVNKLAKILSDRAGRLLGGDKFLEGAAAGDDSRGLVDGKIAQLGVPEQFVDRGAMKKWMEQKFVGLPVRKKLFEAIDLIVREGPSRTELGRLLTEGSRRMTLDRILGTTNGKKEGNLYEAMIRTQAALRASEAIVKGTKTKLGKGVDGLVRNASLRVLSQAQERYLTQEVKQMKRRAELDTLWERTTASLAALSVSTAGLFGLDALRPFLQANSEHAKAVVQELARVIGTTQNCVAGSGEVVSGEVREIIDGSLSGALDWAQTKEMAWDVATKATLAGEVATGALLTGFFGLSVGLPSFEGVRALFNKKTGIAAARPTVR